MHHPSSTSIFAAHGSDSSDRYLWMSVAHPSSPHLTMTQSSPKELLEQVLILGVTQGRIDALEHLIAPEFQLHDVDHPLTSRRDLLHELRLLRHTALKVELRIRALFGDADRASCVFEIELSRASGARTHLEGSIAVHAERGRLTHGLRIIERIDVPAPSRTSTTPGLEPSAGQIPGAGAPTPLATKAASAQPQTVDGDNLPGPEGHSFASSPLDSSSSPTSANADGTGAIPPGDQIESAHLPVPNSGPRTETEFSTRWQLDASQTRIAELIMEGRSDKDIASITGIAPASVRSTVTLILRRARVSNRVQLLHRAQTLQVL